MQQHPTTNRRGAYGKRVMRWLGGLAAVAALGVLAFSATGVLADDDDEGRHHDHHEKRDRSPPGESRSADRQRLNQPMLKAYQTECGSCHMAFEPRFLPAASWQRMMGNLGKHYGTDASLDAATVASVNAWLLPQAGGYKRVGTQAVPEDRITKSPWFERKHHKISTAIFKRASIKSAANCMACHPAADKGNYEEDDVRIPR